MSKRKKRNGVPADAPVAAPGEAPSDNGGADLEGAIPATATDANLEAVTDLDEQETAAAPRVEELAEPDQEATSRSHADSATQGKAGQDGDEVAVADDVALAPEGRNEIGAKSEIEGESEIEGGAEGHDVLEAAAEGVDSQDTDAGEEIAAPAEVDRLESIIMSLLFAADRPLTVADLKRLLGEGDNKRIATALETLRTRYADSGVQLVALAGGWQLRTHPANGPWVAKLVAGRPQRLSRALMETLAIVAYRQPITRPEIDEIRGVDCGPVLRTLLDRNLVRVIGKKEEVGRPILYGTTPEFLKTFSLKDLTELPTLREFHELGAAEKAEVEARAGVPDSSAESLPGTDAPMPSVEELPPPDAAEEDALLDELDRAATAAGRASRTPLDPSAADQEPSARASGGPEADS